MKQTIKLTTADMEIALTHRDESPVSAFRNLVVINRCTRFFGHEIDLLAVSPRFYASEVEIKVSKSDFLADFKKKTTHKSRYIKRFYYAVPYDMEQYAKERLPEDAGLIVVEPRKPFGYVRIAVYPNNNNDAEKVPEKTVSELQRLMAMRYWSRQRALRKKIWYAVVDAYNAMKRKLSMDQIIKRTLKKSQND